MSIIVNYYVVNAPTYWDQYVCVFFCGIIKFKRKS